MEWSVAGTTTLDRECFVTCGFAFSMNTPEKRLKIVFRLQYIKPQTLVSLKKYMPPPLPNFKVNICPFPLPHFASIFFADPIISLNSRDISLFDCHI
jgi:hypothetical protein